MLIVSHRGYWKVPAERNTLPAFERSFSCGFGIETDVRDLDGELVISHDPPRRPATSAGELFELYRQTGVPDLPLALNMKADGLQAMLKDLLAAYEITNYFVFDMSVPDTFSYVRQGMNVYPRQSDYETVPACYEEACGVWLDEFSRHWITEPAIRGHFSRGKQVCIVSPELHGRPHLAAWGEYRSFREIVGSPKLSLCTDFPEQAREFFHG